MPDIRALVQSTLDTALAGAMYVFWQRRTEIDSDTNPDEYIVYTLGGDYKRIFADDEPLTKEADVTIRYYYRQEKANTPAGRALVKSREQTILTALKNAGFFCPAGAMDAGDVDDVGCFVSVIECNYGRVI
jgi:hypothetical protein